MITTEELINKHPEAFKKIGGIFYNLNLVEIFIIQMLSSFFIDLSDPQSEKNFIFNDALSNERIFPNFNNKRHLLERVIESMGKVAKEENVKFNQEKWMGLSRRIEKLQEKRNEIAHHHLVFTNEGRVGYYIRKTLKEQARDKEHGKLGSMRFIEIDLDGEFKESESIRKESQDLIKLSTECLNILISISNTRL